MHGLGLVRFGLFSSSVANHDQSIRHQAASAGRQGKETMAAETVLITASAASHRTYYFLHLSAQQPGLADAVQWEQAPGGVVYSTSPDLPVADASDQQRPETGSSLARQDLRVQIGQKAARRKNGNNVTDLPGYIGACWGWHFGSVETVKIEMRVGGSVKDEILTSGGDLPRSCTLKILLEHRSYQKPKRSGG